MAMTLGHTSSFSASNNTSCEVLNQFYRSRRFKYTHPLSVLAIILVVKY